MFRQKFPVLTTLSLVNFVHPFWKNPIVGPADKSILYAADFLCIFISGKTVKSPLKSSETYAGNFSTNSTAGGCF